MGTWTLARRALSAGPGLRQVELGGDGPMQRGAARRLIGDVVGRDDDLAIGDLAECARILAGHPDRAASLLGQPGVVQDQEALGRTWATRVCTRCWSRAWGSQVASVKRCCKRSVEVPATAAAMVSQFLRGRSVSNPVRYRSTLSRLVDRRKSGAKGAR